LSNTGSSDLFYTIRLHGVKKLADQVFSFSLIVCMVWYGMNLLVDVRFVCVGG